MSEPKPKFGHIYTKQGYQNGANTSNITHYEESVAITDKTVLLSQVLSVLDLALNNNSDEVSIILKRNRSGKLMLVKKWLVS